MNPTPVEAHPSHDSEEGVAYTKAIEEQLQNLDIVKQLREATVDEPSDTTPNTTSLEKEEVSRPRKYKEMRPYSKVPPEKKRHSLTQSTLRGPGMFAVPPLLFYTPDNKECVAIMHLGESLSFTVESIRNVWLNRLSALGSKMCGHNGIVHGGLLATILDEAVARPVSVFVLILVSSLILKLLHVGLLSGTKSCCNDCLPQRPLQSPYTCRQFRRCACAR